MSPEISAVWARRGLVTRAKSTRRNIFSYTSRCTQVLGERGFLGARELPSSASWNMGSLLGNDTIGGRCGRGIISY